MRVVNVIATDNVQSTRNHSLWELLRLNHLNKEEAIHVEKIIKIKACLVEQI